MLSSALNNRIGNTMATIAVSQMLMDRLNSLIRVNKYDVSSIGINSSLDLTINLAQMVGMSYDEIVELITDFLTRNYGQTIRTLDKVVRGVILVALDAMVSCANSPIIGDDLLYDFDPNVGFTGATNPMKINLASIDLYGLFSKSTPTGDKADYYYGDVPSAITPSMTWMSGDLDAFIWHAINMVEPLSLNDASYIDKLVWDNRNKQFKNLLEEEDISQFDGGEMEGYTGSTACGFWPSGATTTICETGNTIPGILKRKPIFRVDYDDWTNSLIIQLPKETYGSKQIFGFQIGEKEKGEFSYKRNRTIYDFNKDYMDNLRIFYVKPVVAAVVNSALNNSLNISFSGTLSLEEEITRGEISKILTKIIESDDTEIEDCYFTFSNDEYDQLIHEAEMRKRGIIVKKGDTNIGVSANTENIAAMLGQMNTTSTLQEQKTIIKNSFTAIASVTGATDDVIKSKLNWDSNSFSNNILQLLKNILMKLLEGILTPRVILIFLINFKFANGELPKTPLDFLSGFLKLLFPVIKELVGFFVEFLFGEVLQKIKDLMEIYILKISLEQLEKYKDIILGLIENCTLNLFIPTFKKTQLIGNIDNVFGADIVETKSEPDKDNC